MPTHRDHPWERDARSGRGLGSRRGVPPSRKVAGASHARSPPARRTASSTAAAAPPAAWRIPIALAIFAVIAIFGTAKLSAPNPVTSATAALPSPVSAPAPQAIPAQAAVASSGTVSALQSRFVGRTTLEVWGRTSAPDGASVRMRVRAAGVSSIGVPEVPAVAGRFYAKVALPPQLQGRGVDISARIAR